jgi:hypothetical protein
MQEKAMHWIEFIRVRTGGRAETAFRKHAGKFESEAEKSGNLVAWHVFRHAAVAGDFSILIQWDTPETNANGSSLAQSLVKNISTVGIVDHSVWTLYTTPKERTAP